MSFSELPQISGKEAVRVYEKVGWRYRGKESGHFVLTKEGFWQNLSIPDHKRLDKGLLHKQNKYAGITDKKFREIYDSL
ncbi:MAG: type II toxin-antitoxin system HicA family toxin [Candidatus Edwardsbacteria bacterium]